MSDFTAEPRTLDWQRFTGAFANAGLGRGDVAPTIGVAADTCPCCDERYIVIAAIHPSGAEVSVSLHPDTALDVAQRIVDSYRQVALVPGKAAQ